MGAATPMVALDATAARNAFFAKSRAGASPSSDPARANRTPTVCIHCAGPVAGRTDGFCCEGCRHVHELLEAEGLGRYYELRSGRGIPALERPKGALEDGWLEVEHARLAASNALTLIEADVEGLHCTGCVWLIEEVFRRQTGEGRVVVNPALGTVELSVPSRFDLRSFASTLEALGYRLGPHRKAGDRPSDDLLWRIGVCAAIAMNAMIFAIARYAGLEDGALEHTFLWLELGLAALAFCVGGIVFFRAAIRGLARGLVHLDLPIAVGLALGYAGSAWAVLRGHGGASFFDTLIVFTTLMLVGRFLRERVLEKNRSQLLEDAGIDGLHCRRIVGERAEIIGLRDIAIGDRLLIAPGDVVPVASSALGPGTLAFDWVTGESEPRSVAAGAAIEAGGTNAGPSAIVVEAREPFSQSRLLRLLRTPVTTDKEVGSPTRRAFESRVATVWVPAVLVAAAIGFGLRLALGAQLEDAIGVAVAVLVVTCPCAFGIATPLAHELVLASLRKRGLLVRSSTFLERALSVRKIVFDKTGTLTNGTLRLSSVRGSDGADGLKDLADEEGRLLYNLASRSSHPKASALCAALPERFQRIDPKLTVVEVPGKGVSASIDGVSYWLGSPPSKARGDVAFGRDREVLVEVETIEDLRPDAEAEVRALARDGYQILLATGDTRARARRVATACGIVDSKIRSEQSPEDKAAFVRAIDAHDTLMVGDGVNDSLAVEVAHASGTPASGRAFLASRADFFLLASGLGPIRLGLAAARALRATLRRNLVWAALYNVGALGLAFAGLMSPLLCALLMPFSSLISIALVTRALGSKGPIWRS
jgi:Cu2+-exporting ATPase